MQTLQTTQQRRHPITSGQIDSLRHEAWLLWNSEPHGDFTQHEGLRLELVDLQLDLERLSLRDVAGTLGQDDLARLEHCAADLDRIKVRWAPAHRNQLIATKEAA